MNISSAILHIAPLQLTAARTAIEQLPGVEIHAESPEGKMVVVIEDSDTNSAADTYVALHGIPGVASVAMVYQYSDDEPETSDTEEVQA